MEDYYCNVLADNVSDFFREKMIYEQRKTDMLIYTTEDGLTKVETTFDGDFKELLLRNLAIKQMDTLDRINLSAVSALPGGAM